MGMLRYDFGMGVFQWLGQNWFELLQTVGIIASLLFTAYAMRRDEKARQISNLSAIKQDYIAIWNTLYERPELARVLDRTVDLNRHPVSTAEWLFVKLLILHLDSVHRAIKAGLFVSVEGMQRDIEEFFKSPIPKAVWDKLRPLQDKEFVRFIETSMR
jgi:hypothetical protein